MSEAVLQTTVLVLCFAVGLLAHFCRYLSKLIEAERRCRYLLDDVVMRVERRVDLVEGAMPPMAEQDTFHWKHGRTYPGVAPRFLVRDLAEALGYEYAAQTATKAYGWRKKAK